MSVSGLYAWEEMSNRLSLEWCECSDGGYQVVGTHSTGARQSRSGEEVSREEKTPSSKLKALSSSLGGLSGRQMSST